MLVSFKEILDIAVEGKFALPAFNVYNMETVMGIIEAAEEAKAPVIIQSYSRLFTNGEGYYVSPIVLAAAEKASVPICFHLDHGAGIEEVTKALRYGATGIMIDKSALDFEENVAETKKIVDMCAAIGVQVEGELGHVGTTADSDMDEFTTAEDAKKFVEQTGVSCLAVAVGTAHGRYKKPPKIDIERIKDIRKATNNTALVLHGGSGVPDEEIKKAVSAGIRKMNFATDICYSFLDTCLEELQKPDRAVAIDNFMKKPIEAIKDFCITRIKLVGADGRA